MLTRLPSIIAIALICLLTCSASVMAEELNAIFKRVEELVAAKNYTKALSELGWARKEIEKLNSGQLQSFFPDKVGDYSGGKIEQNSALGITNLERKYTKGDVQIEASLTGGASLGAGEGLGGLMAFGRAAAMMDNSGNTFRLDGRTASLQVNEDKSGAELSVFMESGGILKLEMQGSGDGEELKRFAQSLKLADLDAYMRGN